MASGCVNRPARFFILPDPVTPFCVSATSQAGPNPGVATTTSAGKLIPVQSGDALTNDAATEYQYQIIKAGGVDSGEFAWQRTDEAKWYGTNDIRHFWGYHSPLGNLVSTGSTCALYQKKTRNKMVIFQNSTNVLRVYSRSADATTPYYTWSGPFSHTIAKNIGSTNYQNIAACEASDGAVLLVVRDENQKVHIFRSEDPTQGNTFELVCEDIVGQALGPGTVLASNQKCQIRIASSGSWIRVCWVTSITPVPPTGSSASLVTFYSSDNGATWDNLAGITIRATDSVNDTVPFDIIGIDDTGSFVLSAVIFSALGSSQGWLTIASARQDANWYFTGNTVFTIPGTIYRLCLSRNDKYVYVFPYYIDRTLADEPHQWTVLRSERSLLVGPNAESASSWENLGYPIYQNEASQWMPLSAFAFWTGSELMFVHQLGVEATGTARTGTEAFHVYGWTERSVGKHGPSVAISDLDSTGWNGQWCIAQGDPAYVGRYWALVTNGVTSVFPYPNRLEMIVSSIGGYQYFETTHGTALGPSNWYNFGGCWRFVMQRVSGTAADIYISAADTSIPRNWNVQIKVLASSIQFFNRGSLAETLTVPTGTAFEIRFYANSSQQARLSVCALSTGAWYTTSVYALSTNSGLSESRVRFGQTPFASGTGTSYWYEVQYTTDGTYMNQDEDFNSPYDLFGGLTTAEPQYIEEGLSVSWAGSGGYRGDEWTGNISYTYPKEAMFVDSPRIAWRSTSLASAQDIIVRAGPTDAVSDNYYTFVHDAVAVFGTNNRYIQIAYDDSDTFSSPTTTATIDCTLFGGQTFTIASAQRASITLSGSSFPWSVGDLVGCYVESTGVAAYSARISRQLASNVLQLDSINGDAISYGFTVGSSVVIYAPFGFTTFTRVNERFMRIRVPYWSSVAEGYYTIGTVVAGTKLDIDVPMDWAHTDDEQPNVTSYRTKSGITWAFAEGPAQRTITGRVVGDAEEWRQKFRALLRQVNYEGKAVVLGADSGTVFKNIMLGRVKSGSALDNAGYYIDSNGYLRPAGDMSLTFVEEK